MSLYQYSKALARQTDKYHKTLERAHEDYISNVKDAVSDILVYIDSYYSFNKDFFKQLERVVLYQLDTLLYRRRDLSHAAIKQIYDNGNIDWFAEPFFGMKQLQLSNLLREYDDLRYKRVQQVSTGCQLYFKLDQFYSGKGELSHFGEQTQSYNNRTSESDYTNMYHPSNDEVCTADEIEEVGGMRNDDESHFKRKRVHDDVD